MTTDLSEPTPEARVAAVRALHRRDEDPVLQTACATGDCEHENTCPTFPLAICGECYGNWEADEERGGSVPAWTLWPCATIRALDNAPSLCGRVTLPGVPAMAGMGAIEECACVRPIDHDDACACAHEAPADAIPTASDRTDAAKIEAAARAIDPDAWIMSAAEFEAEYGGSPDWSIQSQPGRMEGSKTLAEQALDAAGVIGHG